MTGLSVAALLLTSVVIAVITQWSVALAVLVTATFCVIAALRAIRSGQVSGPIFLFAALAYGVMPQFAVAYFDDVLARSNPNLAYDLIPVAEFSMFINLSLILTAFLLPLAYVSSGPIGIRLDVPSSRVRKRAGGFAPLAGYLVTIVCLVTTAIVAFVLVTQYSSLSYRSTIGRGFGRLGSNAIEIAPIVAMATWAVGDLSLGNRRMLFRLFALGTAGMTVVLVTRAGDRGPLLSLVVGAVLYIFWATLKWPSSWTRSTSPRQPSSLARSIVAVAVLLAGASLITNVRTTRGAQASEFSASLFSPVRAFGDLTLEDVVNQDWATPGLMVGMSMTDRFVSPGMVLETSIRNLPGVGIVAGTTSIGERLARRYDPVTSKGYGDYVYRDSYTVAGWFGLPLIPLSLVFFSRLLDRLFGRFRIQPFLAAGIVGTLAIQLVRNQMSIAVRILVLVVLVAIAIVSTFAPRGTADPSEQH